MAVKKDGILRRRHRLIFTLGLVALVCILAAVITVMGPRAEFEVSSLTLSSSEVPIGESVIASATVKNCGDATGTHRIILTVDGEEVDAKEVTLAPGETKTVTFTITKSTQGTYTIEVEGLTKSLKVRIPTPAQFEVSNLSLNPSEVGAGSPVEVSVTVKNVGDLKSTYTVELKVDGVTEDTEDVILAGGAAETVSFTVKKDTPRTYTVEIDGLQHSLRVLKPAAFEVSGLTIEPSEAEVGESVKISVEVKNVGELGGTYEVELKINGSVASTELVTLKGGENTTIFFSVSKSEWGTYQVSVAGLNGVFEVLRPFSYEIESLSVSPKSVGIGEKVTITAKVKNFSPSKGGTAVLELMVNGESYTKNVTLSPREEKSVQWHISKNEEGTYKVRLGRLSTSFVVKRYEVNLARVSVGYTWWAFYREQPGYWEGSITVIGGELTSSKPEPYAEYDSSYYFVAEEEGESRGVFYFERSASLWSIGAAFQNMTSEYEYKLIVRIQYWSPKVKDWVTLDTRSTSGPYGIVTVGASIPVEI